MHLGWILGSSWGQDGPKRGPRGAQEGPKSAQERPKSAPRGRQEAHLKAPTGGARNDPPSFLVDGLQDGPRKPSRAPKKPPRESQEGPKKAPRGPREGFKRAPKIPEKSQTPSESSLGFFCDFWEALWGLLGPSESSRRAPREPQERPQGAQIRDTGGEEATGGLPVRIRILTGKIPARGRSGGGGPKSPRKAPRGPRRAPRGPQDGSKRAPRWLQYGTSKYQLQLRQTEFDKGLTEPLLDAS